MSKISALESVLQSKTAYGMLRIIQQEYKVLIEPGFGIRTVIPQALQIIAAALLWAINGRKPKATIKDFILVTRISIFITLHGDEESFTYDNLIKDVIDSPLFLYFFTSTQVESNDKREEKISQFNTSITFLNTELAKTKSSDWQNFLKREIIIRNIISHIKEIGLIPKFNITNNVFIFSNNKNEKGVVYRGRFIKCTDFDAPPTPLTLDVAEEITKSFHNARYLESNLKRPELVYEHMKRLIYEDFLFKRHDDEVNSLVEDCCKIAQFLVNIEQINTHLGVVESKLEKKLKHDKVNSEEARVKYLSSFFNDELQRFKLSSYGKVFFLLTPIIFRNTLLEKMFLKDSGADPDHGEFTHILQWILILYEKEINPVFTTHDISEIIIFLGSNDSVLASFTNADSYREFNIWDMMVDIFGPAYDNADFRQPERAMLYLRRYESRDAFPILTTLLIKRYDKRLKEYKNKTQEQLNHYKQERIEKQAERYEPHPQIPRIYIRRTDIT